MRSSHRIKGVVVDINGEVELSGPRVLSRVSVRCLIRSTGEIGLQLDFGSVSDVRASAGITFRFKVKCR